MNNIAIAKETIKITEQKYYEKAEIKINLPDNNYEDVKPYSPEISENMLAEDISAYFTDKNCVYEVVNKDSFQAAAKYENPVVLNFANAHFAGGGFLLGANAQEEALCRCSTLYASINSDKASEMYKHNNARLQRAESDYMLYSPEVCVFRNEKCEFLSDPFNVSVITAAAPNRRGSAFLATENFLKETFTRRIRIILRIAAENKHRNIILGAWGCGAFGNKAENVSEYFRMVLKDELYEKCFENICFAIYENKESKNFKAFKDIYNG